MLRNTLNFSGDTLNLNRGTLNLHEEILFQVGFAQIAQTGLPIMQLEMSPNPSVPVWGDAHLTSN